MGTLETLLQGVWKLTWYQDSVTNYNSYNFAHKHAELYEVYLTFNSSGNGVGSCVRQNGRGSYSFSDVQNGDIYFHIVPNQGGETSTYDLGTIYAPLYFQRSLNGSTVSDGGSVSFSPDNNTLTITNGGKTITYQRQ